jgi:hypothetical protein
VEKPARALSGRANEAAQWKRQTALIGAVLLAASFFAATLHGNLLPLYQVQTQDLAPLLLLSASLMLVPFWQPPWRLPGKLPIGSLIVTGLAIMALLGWGTYTLMGNFPLSRDEHMVVFDMVVFDHGRLAMPLASEWRAYARDLVPVFLLNDQMPTGLVSSYLPMNSVLRLGFSKLADPVFFNPFLAFVGGVAVLDIARRTFGRDDRACWVVLLVYVLSAQMLVNAMTTYSMTAHMALNLVWLAAFLRGGKIGNSVAIVTGFSATGLHQIAFHPFFVAPFLLWRLRDGQWKLVFLYAASYAAIVLWWASYPVLASHEVVSQVPNAPDGNLAARISGVLVHSDGNPLAIMFLNLLHFIAWQNFALLPLLLAAIAAVRRDALVTTLLLGIVAWIAFITVILPYQGHGWGYRYLHPYLGSFALLAGYGYRELGERIGTKADGVVLGFSGITAVAAIPLSFLATYRFVEPHVALERFIAAQRTPIVLVDTDYANGMDGRWAPTAIDHVRNLPDLTNRPLRFSSREMDRPRLIHLCTLAPVTIVSRADQRSVGFALDLPKRSPRFEALVGSVGDAVPGCFRKATAVS